MYNLTTMQYIGIPDVQTYYISPTAQAGFINFAPNYTARNTTKLEFTFVPGTFNGSAWVGHMGVIPDISNPDEVQEGNTYRLISYNNGDNKRLDVHNQQQALSTRLDSSTPKIKVEMWDYGINIWDENGTLIETHTWTSGGSWDSGVSIYGWPVKEEYNSGVIEVLENFKLYSVKITDDILGIVYNGVVDENGLYDSVSQTYTTTTGWNIGVEDITVEIIEISHNNSAVYQKAQGYTIEYTSTNNQQITPYTTTGITILEHTFANNVGVIKIDSSTPAIPKHFWRNCTTLQTVKYDRKLTFNNDGYQHDGCSNLESIVLPEKMTKVVQRMLRDNPLIREVTIPATVTQISNLWPFYHTNQVEGIYYGPVLIFKSSIPAEIVIEGDAQGRPFSPTYPNTIIDTIYVPDNAVTTYQAAQYYNSIPNILPISQYPTA